MTMKRLNYYRWCVVAILFGLLYFFGKMQLSVRHFAVFMPLIIVLSFITVVIFYLLKEKTESMPDNS